MKIQFTILVVCSSSMIGFAQNVPSKEVQITTAVLAAPEALREE